MPIPYGMGVLSGILPLSNFLEFHAHASQKEFRVPSLFVREFLFSILVPFHGSMTLNEESFSFFLVSC